MKRLLLPLIAVLVMPTAANAERYWLLLWSGTTSNGGHSQKIEVKNMAQCKKGGESFLLETTYWNSNKKKLETEPLSGNHYSCIEGK